MATPALPPDFREFLRLLNEAKAEYLLIGGYAVNYYGYVRDTADIDFWIAIHPENIQKVVSVLRDFGFDMPELKPEIFTPKRIVRMGVPPFRIELSTSISGLEFEPCYLRRVMATIDGIEISVISLEDLKTNKLATGRLKDRVDVEYLP